MRRWLAIHGFVTACEERFKNVRETVFETVLRKDYEETSTERFMKSSPFSAKHL